MKVLRGLHEPAGDEATAITIGNFDGVHVGHRSIIRKLRKCDALPTLVTFDPHPQEVLRGETPPRLASPERRLALLEEAGVQQVMIIPFDLEFSKIEPEEFIDRVLVKTLHASAVIVGANFRFGRFARGDVTMLRTAGRSAGFRFEAARITRLANRTVSSTEIRHAIQAGDLKWANKALARPHEVEGVVIQGEGRGRALGFPTANISPQPHACIPSEGIYYGFARVREGRFAAAISIGTNPTFGENPLTIEAFLLDFSGNLYGQDVAFEFVGRIRDQKKFLSRDELVDAIEDDVRRLRRLLP